jgi:ribosomal protein L7Ae-like RNA K-turn-binding protein
MSGANRVQSEGIRGLLGLARKGRGLSIGSRETRAALHRGDVRLVLLAADGSPRDRERLERISAEQSVPVRVTASRAELGEWIGRGPVAVLGIRDPNLATAVSRRFDRSTGGARDVPGRENAGGRET